MKKGAVMISILDFYPNFQPSIGDFYPHGFSFQPQLKAKREMGPDAVAVITALADRLINGAHAEIELLTIMEFCDRLLQKPEPRGDCALCPKCQACELGREGVLA